MRAIIDNPDGSVRILIPAKGMDINEVLARQGITDAVIVEDHEVPSDRTFRNAWVKGQGPNKVDVDMPKAREIHMTKIRKARDKKLADMDVQYMRADEAGNASEKAAIAQQKQALRDIPTTFDLSVATTPDELKALWPAELA